MPIRIVTRGREVEVKTIQFLLSALHLALLRAFE